MNQLDLINNSLLGRPWQFDKRANHGGYSNKYSFVHNERKVTLAPLSPREVCEDQNKLREKKSEKNSDSQVDKKRAILQKEVRLRRLCFQNSHYTCFIAKNFT